MKLKKYIEITVVSILMFYTLQYSYHSLNQTCIALYTYDQDDLLKIYQNKSKENLWFIAQKIQIMDVCTHKDYKVFLEEVIKDKEQVVDFRGYEYMSKGLFVFHINAKAKLDTLKGISK